ncbi:MAG: alpha/beta hydrolase, partial [Sulfitobacter sp.]
MSVRHVSVGRQSIAVHDNGGEGIPLFLMTGFIGTASFWDPFVNALPSGCRVIRYDQRGCGASGAYDEPLEMEQLANDALAVISQLNLPKVHVIGHSMGACAAWIMAAKNPAVLRSSY